MRPSKVLRPIFLIGMPRSGTSALAEAISLHEELGWFSNYLNRFSSLPWLAVLDRITNISSIGWHLRGQKKQNRSLKALIRRCLPYCSEANPVWFRHCGEKFLWEYLNKEKATAEELDNITSCITKVLQYQQKSRFFTKFTGPPRIHYLDSIFRDAYFIHVIRDPRAVVSSLFKATFWKEGGGLVRPWWRRGLTDNDIEQWEASDRSPVVLNAVQWRRVVELTWEEKESILSERYLEIRYEDFVEEPHEALSMVFEKVGLKDSNVSHRYVSSIGGLINMNYKYREHLRVEEIAMIEKITGQTAKRVGYDYDK